MPQDEAQDVNTEVVQDTTAPEASTDENVTSEASSNETDSTETTEDTQSDDAQSTDETDTSEDSAQSEDESESDSTTEEDVVENKPTGADKRKQQLEQQIKELEANTEIRELVKQKNELKSLQEEQQSLIDQGYDPAEARLMAIEQREMLREQYVHQEAQVNDLNYNLNVDALKVFQDFPVFDKNSPDYDPEFASDVNEMYSELGQLQTDELGRVVSVNQPLYQFFSKQALIRDKQLKKSEVTAQRSVEKQMAAAETIPRSNNVSGGNDSLNDLKERVANYKF